MVRPSLLSVTFVNCHLPYLVCYRSPKLLSRVGCLQYRKTEGSSPLYDWFNRRKEGGRTEGARRRRGVDDWGVA